MGGRRRSQVIVQGPSAEELAQREQQFKQQMEALQRQSDQQQAALTQQLVQQRQAAEAKQTALQQQLKAAGNVNANNALQTLMQVLTQQTSVSQEARQERELDEATQTQKARSTTRANIGKRQQAQTFADLLTNLQTRRRN